MTFKLVRAGLVFSALVGVSLAVVGVASADSTTPDVNATNYQDTHYEINSSDASVNQQSSQNNSQTATGQSSNSNSQNGTTTVTANETVYSATNDGTPRNPKQTTGISTSISQASENNNQDSVASGQNRKISSGPSESQVVVTNEVQDGINRSSAQNLTNKNDAVTPAVTHDSGGVTAPSSEPSPSHPTPMPIGGLVQFNALLHSVVMPLSQTLGMGWQTAEVLRVSVSRTVPLLVLLMVVVLSLFVVNLRRSGFSHGARSDIPGWVGYFATPQKVSFALAIRLNASSLFSGHALSTPQATADSSDFPGKPSKWEVLFCGQTSRQSMF